MAIYMRDTTNEIQLLVLKCFKEITTKQYIVGVNKVKIT